MTPMMLSIRRVLPWALVLFVLFSLAAGLLHQRPSVRAAEWACVPARPHAPGDFSETIVSGGTMRSYKLHVPPSYVEDEPMPLILNWHGLGGSATGQQSYSQLPVKADTAGFIVAAPQGLGGPANHNFATIAPEPDDVLFTNDLLDELESQLCIDPARIFSTGMSNGAQMSTRLGCNASERIAAIAPVAGWYFPPFSPNFPTEPGCISARPMPVIAFHGDADGIIPFEGGPGLFGILFRSFEDEIMPEWAAHNGCDSPPEQIKVAQNVRRYRHENCDEGAALDLYLVQGGGHVWPGAVGATQEISANDFMWDFFRAHPLDIEKPVGGIAELPAAAGTPLEAGGAGASRGLLAGVVAGALAAGGVAAGGAAWYARRRWTS